MRRKTIDTIIIFGFSGSGKSTMANLVGRRLRLRVIHSSGILRDLFAHTKVDVKRTVSNRGFWEGEKGQRLLKGRLKEAKPMDLIGDRILLRELRKGKVVMDSWSMPWLSKKGFKIFLHASLACRARRVAERSKLSLRKAMRIVRSKDEDTRAMFKRLYGFDIKKDVGVFDHIIKTDRLTKKEVLRRVMESLR